MTHVVTAPAKINLGLRILGRRADGYHEIESLFVPLDLADLLRIDVRPATTGRVSLTVHSGGGTDARVPGGSANLACRAAERFLEATGLDLAIDIVLEKHTPAAAGLGGGSSDAAAVLRTLTASSPGALAPDALAALALDLGADVPFFLDPRPTWVRGIGEVLEPATGVPTLSLVLANPGVAVPTAEVYRAFDALRSRWTPRPAPGWPASNDPREDAAGWGALLENDLAPPAIGLCPPIARVRDELRHVGATVVGLSGSGATLYGLFADATAAQAALDRADLGADGWGRVAVTRESG